MIVGLGVDLAEVERIADAIARYGDRFLSRVYTPQEIASVGRNANAAERYAARFAAKEAGMKALGTGWSRGIRWQDFEVANLPSGQPTLRLAGQASQVAHTLGVRRIRLSLTHARSLALAVVILEGGEN